MSLTEDWRFLCFRNCVCFVLVCCTEKALWEVRRQNKAGSVVDANRFLFRWVVGLTGRDLNGAAFASRLTPDYEPAPLCGRRRVFAVRRKQMSSQVEHRRFLFYFHWFTSRIVKFLGCLLEFCKCTSCHILAESLQRLGEMISTNWCLEPGF
jgi:hypothetical protein